MRRLRRRTEKLHNRVLMICCGCLHNLDARRKARPIGSTSDATDYFGKFDSGDCCWHIPNAAIPNSSPV